MSVGSNNFPVQNGVGLACKQAGRVNWLGQPVLFGYKSDILLTRHQPVGLLTGIQRFFGFEQSNRLSTSPGSRSRMNGLPNRVSLQSKDQSWLLKGFGVLSLLGIVGLAFWMHRAGSLSSQRTAPFVPVGSSSASTVPLTSLRTTTFLPASTGHSSASPIPSAKTRTATSAKPVFSQEKLLEIFQIPYSFDLHTLSNAQKGLDSKQVLKGLKTANLVALGDLHGSYYKLIETLVAASMITMPPAVAKTFLRLAEDVKGITGTVAEKQALYAQLKALIPQMKWVGGTRQLLLIGDVLADRGPFDNITLDIIEYFTKDHPERLIRLASNHDHEALIRLGGQLKIAPHQSLSMQSAYAIANANGTQKALENSYKNYLKQSKLMHYDPDKTILYTHAPVNDEEIKTLISEMNKKGSNISFDTITNPAGIAQFVEQANAFYAEYVERVTNTKNLENGIEEMLCGPFGTGFLWTRNNGASFNLPFKNKGVERLVHGHTNGTSPHTINLDQNVRKGTVNPLGESSPLFCH